MSRFNFRRFNKELGFMQPVATPQEGDMQSTGLTDKNGKEIYEGDIVKHLHNSEMPPSRNCFIRWNKSDCCFELGYCNTPESKNAMSFTGKESIEVIGNIYDNPGLLK